MARMSNEPITKPTPAPSPLSQAETWDLVSSGYVDVLMSTFTEYARDALQAVDPSPDAHVLDVAAGPGTLTLLAAGRTARVTAVDFSAAMLSQARERTRAAGFANVDFHEEDAQKLPFEDNRFDAAFSMFGLIFFPDRGAGLRELHRVLRRDGRVALTSWMPFSESPALNEIFSAVSRHLDTPFGKNTPPPLGTPELIHEELGAAGFVDIEVRRIDHPATAASLETYWADMVRSSAPVTLLHRKMGAGWPAFEAKVLAELEARLGAGPFTVPAPAWLSLARKP